MFRLPRIAALLVAVCLLSSVACAGPVQYFQLDNGPYGSLTTAPGNSFLYWSKVTSPGEVYEDGQIIAVVFDWVYDYYIENGSSDQSIVSWYWQADGVGGPENGRILSENGLAPASSAGLNPSDKRFRSISDASVGFVLVDSVITFSNGYSQVVPVHVPSNVVPEPSSLVILAACVGSALSALRKR